MKIIFDNDDNNDDDVDEDDIRNDNIDIGYIGWMNELNWIKLSWIVVKISNKLAPRLVCWYVTEKKTNQTSRQTNKIQCSVARNV